MAYVYILFSEQLDKFYIGFTTLTVEDRLQKHVSLYYENKFTAKADDWTIFLEIECKNQTVARKIEAHIKAMKSKKYIQNLKKYPEIRFKLLEKYDNE
jgi:putative endonuclease